MTVAELFVGQTVRTLVAHVCGTCGRTAYSRDRISGSECGFDGCPGTFVRRLWGRPKKDGGQSNTGRTS